MVWREERACEEGEGEWWRGEWDRDGERQGWVGGRGHRMGKEREGGERCSGKEGEGWRRGGGRRREGEEYEEDEKKGTRRTWRMG